MRCHQVVKAMLDKLGVDQPRWSSLTSVEAARDFCSKVGYPVLVRPSYVLSGAAMNVAYSAEELQSYLGMVSQTSTHLRDVWSLGLREPQWNTGYFAREGVAHAKSSLERLPPKNTPSFLTKYQMVHPKDWPKAE